MIIKHESFTTQDSPLRPQLQKWNNFKHALPKNPLSAPLQVPSLLDLLIMPTTLHLAGSLFGSLNVDDVAKVTEKNQSNPKNSEV